MTGLLSQLVPTGVAGAISPLPIVLVISLLVSERGLAKAGAFAGALTAVFAAIGAFVLSSAGTDAGATETGSAVTGTVIAVLGGVLIAMAIKQLAGAADPDAAPPKLLTRIDRMSAASAAGLGVVMSLVNFKQLAIFLAGVDQIVEEDISQAQGWVALVILLVIVQVGVVGPILAFVVARDRATGVLQRFLAWLVRNNRVISIVLGLVVGGAFLIKGIAQIIE